MAMTADGKIATANRAVHTFGSRRDLEHLYELRATADAVMCGARTVEISQATLGNGGERFRQQRLRRKLTEYPVRVVVSGSGTLDPASEIFKTRFSPLLILTTRHIHPANLRRLEALATVVKICGETEINFPRTLHWLHQEWGVQRLLCEGGGELNDALFRADLVDEINLTICPKIFGGRTAPTIADGLGLPHLAQAKDFKIRSFSAKKGELFTVFSRS